jgi:GH15 family glucan-1,4-alpha-glucosidase
MPRPSIGHDLFPVISCGFDDRRKRLRLRYRTGETDDGMSGNEGTFLICSFWLVSALAIIGEEQGAVT